MESRLQGRLGLRNTEKSLRPLVRIQPDIPPGASLKHSTQRVVAPKGLRSTD